MKVRFSLLPFLSLAVAMCGCNTASDTPANDSEPEAKAQPRVEARAAVEDAKAPAADPVVKSETPKQPAKAEPPSEPPALPAELTRVHTHRTHFNSRTSNSLKKNVKLPEAAGVMCGQFPALAGKNTLACITRSENAAPWGSIIIDLNRNRDLTDDKVYPLPANKAGEDFAIEADGRKIAFTAHVSQNGGQVSFSLRPKQGRTGVASLNGKDAQWIACDCNLSGRLDAGDKVYFDGNGNGKIAEGSRDPVRTLEPETLLFVEKSWYSLAAPDGEKLEVALYDGEMRRLTIDHAEITEEKGIKHDLRLYLQDSMVSMGGVDPAEGVEVPPAVIKYLAGAIKLTPKSVGYTVRNLNLKEDKLLKLTRPRSQLSVSQSGGKINVNQRIVSDGGVRFNIARAKPGPAVEVYSERSPDEPLTKGNMAYG